MNASRGPGEPLVAETRGHVPRPVMALVGLLGFLAAVGAVVNLVRVPFADSPGSRVLWTVLCLAVALVAMVLVGLIKDRMWQRVTVDGSGVTIREAGAETAYPWSEMSDLALVVGGRLSGRNVVVEGQKSAEAAERSRKLAKMTRTSSGALPFASMVRIRHMNVDEEDVLAAVREFSEGRFPGPTRRLSGPAGYSRAE